MPKNNEPGTEKAFPVKHVPEDPALPPSHKMVVWKGGDQKESDLAVHEDEAKVKEPRKYAVILHNDNYTTMEFVVEVLSRFFGKVEEEAVQIMLQVHNTGRGVCGAFTHEIAETKVMQVHEYAKYNGFPLKCSMEPL